ncbi:hypothetical protein GT354_24755, partial [Streptomyces sp. SID3343]|nr:hypothetical protein [Streptomyces sp. SID3343]
MRPHRSLLGALAVTVLPLALLSPSPAGAAAPAEKRQKVFDQDGDHVFAVPPGAKKIHV